jgi:ParB-like chromosome segregation protein Spo0J
MSWPTEENSAVYIDVAIDKIGESYARYRLIRPHSESSMFKSVRRFGQLTPVVVDAEKGGGHEMIDGFKRLRALRQLKRETIRAKAMEGRPRTLKVAMIQLNREVHSMGSMEESLLVQSLYREEGLDQVEISALLGRDKSWASRRISLIEKLSEEVLEHLRLGLISPTQGRELIRLPRGNPKDALDTVLKHRLSTRETRRLVSMLIDNPRWSHEQILWLPLEILSDRNPPRPPKDKKASLDPFDAALLKLEKCCNVIVQGVEEGLFLTVPDCRASVLGVIEQTLAHLKDLLLKGPF